MAEEAPDEVRERIRADLRRAGLLPAERVPLLPEPARRVQNPQRSLAAFLIGFLAPALVIVVFTLILGQIGGG